MPCVSLVFYVIVDSLPTVLLFPSPLFLLPPPPPTGALVWSALPHHTPSTVLKTGRFYSFSRALFFLGLIAQPGGRVLFEDMTSLL